MKEWFRKIFKKKPNMNIVITDSCNNKPNLTQKEAEILWNYKCPDCGGDLYSGPSGGMMTNVRCDKGHRFNITNPEIGDISGTPFFCQRI